MELKDVKPLHRTRRSRRVGRGGKRGTYSGKGIKGQRSRSGARIRPQIRDLVKKIPKLRGTGFFRQQKTKRTVINIDILEKKFAHGERVSPTELLQKGLISQQRGKLPKVKLLGSGNLTKKLLVAECQVSKGAREKIEKAGGTIQTKQ